MKHNGPKTPYAQSKRKKEWLGKLQAYKEKLIPSTKK